MKNLLSRYGSRGDASRLVATPSDAFLLIRIFSFAAFVPLLLRLPLRTVDRVVTPRRRLEYADAGRVQTITAMTEAVIGRRFVGRSCLVRGTTLYYFLSRAGQDVDLSFGIGLADGKFAGHCWLVKDGQPYLEQQDPQQMFTVIYSIPHDGTLANSISNVHRMTP